MSKNAFSFEDNYIKTPDDVISAQSALITNHHTYQLIVNYSVNGIFRVVHYVASLHSMNEDTYFYSYFILCIMGANYH